MGEVAGMSFGSNYVIMMQIGYNYYAPRIIAEMEKGKMDNPLSSTWWKKWQTFLRIYSDQSIKNTMDRTLEMPEAALDAIWNKMSGAPKDVTDITDTSALQLGEISQVRYTPSRDRQGDREKTDALLAAAIQKLKDAYEYGSQLTNKKRTSHLTPKKKLTFAELKQTPEYLKKLRAQEQQEKRTARAVSAIKSTITKRLAGQSQIMARKRLSQEILQLQNVWNGQMRNKFRRTPNKNILILLNRKKTQLTVLLTRYRFK